MNKIYGSVIAICIIVILAIFAGIINESLKPSRGSPNFSAFVVYNPYAEGLKNHKPKEHWSQFLADLDFIKDLGFQGVKLHDVYKFWNDSILVDCVRAMKSKGLDVIIQLKYFNVEQFPQNTTHTTAKLETMKSIADQLKDEDNILWYSLNYPWDWSLRKTYIQNLTDPLYKSEMQRMVDGIRESDPNHPIFLVSENIEYWCGNPPYDIDGIGGYGYMPYSRIPNDIQYEETVYGYYEHFINIARPKGLQVYIDEWGFQTNAPSKTGYSSNENSKCSLITSFINSICSWKIVWCYYALHDRTEANWGLVYGNNTLKESGKTMKQLLAGQEVPFWMQWWFWAIVAVLIVALAGAVYFLKKRKPPTPTAPTPTPAEGYSKH